MPRWAGPPSCCCGLTATTKNSTTRSIVVVCEVSRLKSSLFYRQAEIKRSKRLRAVLESTTMTMTPLKQQLHEFALEASTEQNDHLKLLCQHRSSLLHAIEGEKCPLQLLQPFVSKWRSWLTTLKNGDSPIMRDEASIALLCVEYLQLAQTLQRMARFQESRSALHHCLVLSQAADTANQHGNERDAFLSTKNEAKQALLECIQLQDAMSECTAIAVTRAHAPPEVLTHDSSSLHTSRSTSRLEAASRRALMQRPIRFGRALYCRLPRARQPDERQSHRNSPTGSSQRAYRVRST